MLRQQSPHFSCIRKDAQKVNFSRLKPISYIQCRRRKNQTRPRTVTTMMPHTIG